jgi:PST family polysaccharide transporter
VLFVLGPQWRAAVPLFRLLAPAAILGALLNPFGWLFQATGRPDRQFRFGILWSGLLMLSFVAGLPFGPAGVAIGYSTISCILVLPLCYYAVQGTSVRIHDLWEATRAPIVAALIAGSAGLMVKSIALAESPVALRAIVGCVVVVAIYSVCLFVVLGKWQHYRSMLRESRK